MKDFQSLKRGTFKKQNITFNLKEVLGEISELINYKAKLSNNNMNFDPSYAQNNDLQTGFVKRIQYERL
jgi:hypothetical protein